MNLKQLVADTQPAQLILLSKPTLHSILWWEVMQLPFL